MGELLMTYTRDYGIIGTAGHCLGLHTVGQYAGLTVSDDGDYASIRLARQEAERLYEMLGVALMDMAAQASAQSDPWQV